MNLIIKPVLSLFARLFLIIVFLITVTENTYAKEPLGKQWPSSQQISIEKITHVDFDKILKKHVDQNGYVNYKELKSSSGDRKKLQNYLAQLSKASRKKKSSLNARLAFWINAYNAVTLEGILQVYPTTSIRNHTAKLFGYNIWKELPLIVGNEKFSLEQIEHEILRKMNEPRIHFAIVCASIGCPRLLNQAYVADKINQQLTNNAKDFFSRNNNFQLDVKNKIIYLSSILDWFGSDFGNSQTEILKSIVPYLPDSEKKKVLKSGYRISFLTYNWKLNDQSRFSG